MMMHRVYYIPLLIFLGFLYAVFFTSDGYRIPEYYALDGTIVPFGEDYAPGKAERFFEVHGSLPSRSPAIFKSDKPVVVVTDQGAGIMSLIPTDTARILMNFKFIILYSFAFAILGLWFIEYGTDYHLATLSFIFAAFLYTSFTSFAFHQLNFLWLILAISIVPALINMALRTTGKEISGYLLLGEIVYLLFFIMIAYVGRGSIETASNLLHMTRGLLYATIPFVVFVQLENALKSTDDPIERLKRWVLVGGSFAGLLLPFLWIMSDLPRQSSGDPMFYPMLLTSLFPLSIVYGTYRIHLTPFQFTLNRSITTALLTAGLVALYGIVLLTHSLLIPGQTEQYQWIVNIVFILILVFFLDPIRKNLGRFVETNVFQLNPELTSSLEKIADTVSAPASIQKAIHSLTTEIQTRLHVDRIYLLLSEQTFPDVHIKHINILRLSEYSRLWKHFAPEKIIVRSYLTYGGGSRGELYQFLTRYNIYMAVGVRGTTRTGLSRRFYNSKLRRWMIEKKILREEEFILPAKTALLVGHRKDGRKLRLSETRYLQESSRLAAMLINNYSLLIQELEKRKRVRELIIAGELQRTQNRADSDEITGVNIAYMNLPVISVTGDYVDVIRLPSGGLAIFLGDVSGHGLGTGYLVSAIRAIVRYEMENYEDLGYTFSTINDFLRNRYSGSEYATLFGMILHADRKRVDYINAGHPSPFLYNRHKETLSPLPSGAGLIGIMDNRFLTTPIWPLFGDRLYLYSDGVTETLDQKDVPFGTQRLKDSILEINQNWNDPLETQIRTLYNNLEQYRSGLPVEDDTSFLIIEFSGGETQEGGISVLTRENLTHHQVVE